jgi:anti-anti-sigma factor
MTTEQGIPQRNNSFADPRVTPQIGFFKVHVRREDLAAVVVLRGSAGMVEAPQIAKTLETLLTEKPLLIVLDLSELEFIGSAGLAAIVQAFHRSRVYGGQVRLARVRPQVLGVLERTALTRSLPVYATTEQALCAWPSHLGRVPMFVMTGPEPVWPAPRKVG